MMKTLLRLFTGLIMMGALALLLMPSRTNATASLRSEKVTPTPQSGPIVSEPVSPVISQEVKSLPSNQGPYIYPPREINPLQNNPQAEGEHDKEMTPTPQIQVPTLSEPVAPTISEPVKNLPTAEPYDGSTPIEVNPRQNPQNRLPDSTEDSAPCGQ